METPSRSDWGDVDRGDLDAAWAFDTFSGKTFQEARALFAEHALYYQENLLSMPPVPFRFYLRAFIDYVDSDDASGDSDGAASFLALVIEALERHRAVLDRASEDLLIATARRIASRQDFYNADVSIYGDFRDQFRRIARPPLLFDRRN